MQRRKWDAETQAMLVVKGLKGKPVAAMCPEHQISQAQSDEWRDPFLAQAATAFEVHEQSRREARLAREHARLKTLVGELTVEFKKSDARLGCAGSRPLGEPGAPQTGLSTSERSRLPIRSGAIGVSGRTGAWSRRSPCIKRGDGG
jgi:hypothetical protein